MPGSQAARDMLLLGPALSSCSEGVGSACMLLMRAATSDVTWTERTPAAAWHTSAVTQYAALLTQT